MFDCDGNRSDHVDKIVESDIAADGACFLSTLKQTMPFGGNRVAPGRAVLDYGSKRSSQALVSARVPRKLFEISAYRIAWRDIDRACTAGLCQRHETFVAGSGQQGFTRRKAAIKRTDPDASTLGDFLQWYIRPFFQKKRLGGSKNQLAVFLCVSPEGRFITHYFPLLLVKWRIPPYYKWSNPPLIERGIET